MGCHSSASFQAQAGCPMIETRLTKCSELDENKLLEDVQAAREAFLRSTAEDRNSQRLRLEEALRKFSKACGLYLEPRF
jgi:hypothetical protein